MAQFHLAIHFVRHQRKQRKNQGNKVEESISNNQLPLVTVQLPIYNELYVVERLIDKICEFDYPKDKMQIQVLDDSTDETLEISRNKVNEYAAKGFDIEMVTRPDRKGYKAGALAYGNQTAKGEFIAIFDADFLPKPDFLKNTLPSFNNDKIGMVQTRWEHINENYSLLTRIQAFILNFHFTVEQQGRNAAGYCMNFNGTAGIWRRKAIDDAGGWRANSITEDLDLSYRAQLNGWKFKYLLTQGSPAELPSDMPSLKSQQFRWNKGGAENARMYMFKILKSKLPWSSKIHAYFHLFSSTVYLCILISAILSIPLLYAKNSLGIPYFKYASVFVLSTLAIAFGYFVASFYEEEKKKSRWFEYLMMFPVFLVITLGLSLHNGIAVFRGWLGEKTAFIRTPKFNITKLGEAWHNKSYTSTKIPFTTWLEALMALYFGFGVYLGIQNHDYGLIPFHVAGIIGFSVIFFFSVKHAKLAG